MTRQCPLFHETVLAEWRCVVIQVLFNASYHTVFNVDNLVCLIGNAALVGYDHDGHARFMQVFQNLHDLYGSEPWRAPAAPASDSISWIETR